MSIQPFVTAWAILCFLVLAFALNKILFKPMLKLMDARRAKIEKAKADRIAAKEEYENTLLRMREEREEQKREQRHALTAQLEEVRSINARNASERRTEYNRRLAENKIALSLESDEIRERLEQTTDMLARGFADRVEAYFVDKELEREEYARRDEWAKKRAAHLEEQERAVAAVETRIAKTASNERILSQTVWDTAKLKEEYTQLTDEQFAAVESGVLEVEHRFDPELSEIAASMADSLTE